MRSSAINQVVGNEQPVLLQRPAILTSAFIWIVIAMVTGGVTWAAVAQIDQSVPAQGKLEPEGSVKEVKAPDGGVLREMLVEDGERVEEGQLLATFDPTAPEADVDSLRVTQEALEQQARLLRAEQSILNADTSETALAPSRTNVLNLKRNREIRVAENRYFQALLQGAAGLAPNQSARLAANFNAHQSNLNQLRAQILQLRSQIDELVQDVENARVRRLSLENRLVTAQERLSINQGIVADLTPLVEEGAVPRLQYKQQQQQVLSNQESIDALQGEIGSLREQEQRSIAAINTKRAEILTKQQELRTADSQWRADIQNRIAQNDQSIADIDAQLARADLDNRRQIESVRGQVADVEGRIVKAEQQVRYQELRAPISGTVFNIEAGGPGDVAGPTEPILSIVPDDDLVAKVFVTNKDIGFIEVGMPVEVRIDSFPALEFGAVDGELVSIGSDALPPEPPERQTYTFPLTIELDTQTLQTQNNLEFDLQSGMSVSARIKTRKRSVLDIFLSRFKSRVDSFETVR